MIRLVASIKGSLKYKLILSFIAISIIPLVVVGYMVNRNATEFAVSRDTAYSNVLNYNKMAGLDRLFGELEQVMSELVTNYHTTYYLQNLDSSNFETDRSYNVLSEVGAKLDSVITSKPLLYKSIALLPQKEGGLPLFRGELQLSYSKDFTALPLYQASVKEKTRALWSYAYEDGEPNLIISRSINDMFSDDVLGVAFFFIDVDILLDELTAMPVSEGESLQIVNEQRQIIYHTDRARNGSYLGPDEQTEQIWQQESGNLSFRNEEGTSVVTFMTSRVNGWKIIHRIPYANIVQGVGQISNIVLLITAIASVFAIIAATIVYIHMYKPISLLMKAMKRADFGLFQKRVELHRTDELGSLARAFNHLVERVEFLIEDVKAEQKKKKEQEVRALQAQITPHFLYNTLNAIKSLARLGRPKDIEQMSGSLIDLLRISASHRTDTIRIRDELNYVRSYVNIMEYRYRMPIIMTCDADDDLLNYGILKFTLQPIVENSIIHAFTPEKSDRRIAVDIHRTDNGLRIVVSDNGKGMKPEELQGDDDRKLPARQRARNMHFSGVGVRNIQERIRLHYGERFGLRFDSEAGKGTTVTIEMPIVEIEEPNLDRKGD